MTTRSLSQYRNHLRPVAVAALSLAFLSGGTAAQSLSGGGTGGGGAVGAGAARGGPALVAPATGQAPGTAAPASATPTPSAATPLPGQSAQPSQLPPLNANGLNGQVPVAAPGSLPSRSDTATGAFRMLDRSGVGYVTRADTDRIPGFVGFDNADSNRDGQLTPEEFNNAWRFYSGQ
jgi:hypothetical protein